MTFKFKTKEDYVEAYMYLLRIGEGFRYNVDKETIEIDPEAMYDSEEVIARINKYAIIKDIYTYVAG